MTADGYRPLPNGWVWTILGEVCDPPQYGWTTKASAKGNGPRLLRTTDITPGSINWDTVPSCTEAPPDIGHYRLRPGDIVISRAGSVGVSALIGDCPEAVFASYLIRFRPLPEVCDRYISYFLRSPLYWHSISEASAGIALQNVNAKKLASIRIPVAPLPEQRRIVGEIEKHLTRLDAAVHSLQRVRANLKRYRASVLKAACEGRLVPTEAELARREGRSYEPASVLLERILKERRAHWEAQDKRRGKYREPQAPDTSNLPPLPEGWVWATWEQVGFSQNGRAFPSSEYQDSGVKLLRPGNLHASGQVKWTEENTRNLAESWAERFPGYIVGPDELIMNLTAQSLKDEFLGRTCMTGPSERCLLNQRLARLTPLGSLSKFVLYVLMSEIFRSFVARLNTGSLIQHMFTSQLAGFALPLPPLAEQHRIVAEVERHLSVIQAAENVVEANLKRAERLRQAILKRAFQGKLVPQDPTDEPASVLLERIRVEREQAGAGSPERRRRGGRRSRTQEVSA